MSIRHKILAALKNNPMIMDGLVDATGLEKRRLSDNMQGAIREGLVNRDKDDVTGLPLYRITKAGLARLAEGPQSMGGVAAQKKFAQKKAAQKSATAEKPAAHVVDEIDASLGATEQSDDTPPPADAVLLASANRMLSERLAGVAHALRGSGLPALANIDDGEDLQQHVAALTGAYQMALDDNKAWTITANYFGCSDRAELFEFVEKMQLEGTNSVTGVTSPAARSFQGYACMVGGAAVYASEADAMMEAEQALAGCPAGQEVAVVAILAQAVNVIAPMWKQAA